MSKGSTCRHEARPSLFAGDIADFYWGSVARRPAALGSSYLESWAAIRRTIGRTITRGVIIIGTAADDRLVFPRAKEIGRAVGAAELVSGDAGGDRGPQDSGARGGTRVLTPLIY